jgi:hypothetical protein
MKPMFRFLIFVCFFWGLFEACDHAKNGNPVVVVPATTIARFVTSGIDAVTCGTVFETNCSAEPKPWVGISTTAVLLLLVSNIYVSGFKDGAGVLRYIADNGK